MASWQHLEITVNGDETYVMSGFGVVVPPVADLRWYEVISDLGDQGWELVHVMPFATARQFWFKRPKRA